MPYRMQKDSFETYREGGTLPSIRVLVSMLLVVRAFRNKMDEELRKIGQNCARMEIMGAIMNIQGPKSQSDIAKRLRVENATITRMVDILSKEGLVERAPHPTDRRVNLLSISAQGEEVLRKIFAVYDAVRDHVLEGVPEEDYDRLQGIFAGMLARLDVPIDTGIRAKDVARVDRLKH